MYKNNKSNGQVIGFVFSLLFVFTLGLGAQDGEIGMKAPVLEAMDYVKGKPVDFKGEKDTIYVVEFWATWCGPCKQSIPVLTQLQKEYEDKKVRIIGISDEAKSKVTPFVDQMGSQMDYTVAVSKGGATHKKYMGAFGSQGIPHAFIVNQDKHIVWEGHPLAGMKEVLDKVIAGDFDVATAKAHAKAQKEEQQKRMQEAQAINQYLGSAASGTEDMEALKKVEGIIEASNDNPTMLNQVAWIILTHPQIQKRNFDLALMAAAKGHESDPENPNIMDTYSLALAKSGQKAKAIEVQKKAIALVKGDEKRTKLFEENLKKIEEMK